ncbi:phosphonate C-P lyase system protein PhnH [Paenibacillus aceris]|uniref:Alpha-D-ribose 1-methylphosphonate 5-triphosphate synthase subunit PhnH n=1 Tax=Paenibacillus aceris TaxID=869555 RepID=A0ABS4I9B4_9BACL|nr:phosphonate C-P lyase system protein PhnH [Paenibacillus aceris]MBP1967522.1 alpha-D-ribose 1-methylphosphonate 5-triphosphate synthase subunit PhnH [Paenibacillus aceris]NHW35138.1 phosphonate C-P lyase system protein PhnH [Paenibacillus aceris]
MKLDMVHDIQAAYRKLIDSMSKPGTISDLSEEAGKLEQFQGCLPATYIAAQMLLDTEVTFKVVSEREGEVTHLLSQSTYAKEAALEEADFIFVLRDAAPGYVYSALEAAKIGELMDPHCSATLIIEAEGLSCGTKLELSGPGIQTTAKVEIQAAEDWIDIRAERNAEFPLGLDLIFTDTSHRILALPRTTQVVKEEI